MLGTVVFLLVVLLLLVMAVGSMAIFALCASGSGRTEGQRKETDSRDIAEPLDHLPTRT